MLKKIMAAALAFTVFTAALPLDTSAVPSGAGVEYDYYEEDIDNDTSDDDDDDEYTAPSQGRANNNNNNDDDDDTPTTRKQRTVFDENGDTERRVGEGQFVYAEESTSEATTVAIIVDQSGVSTPEGIKADINIMAEAAALIDAKTGTMLYGKNADQKMYPASMTKVMTVLLACEKGNLDDMVTVSENAVNSIPWDSSKADLEVGEELSLSDLLHAVILVSGNDAAVVVAEHIAGSEEAFVRMMNERAKELGCENTHFVNPHGYHDEDHYTTPHDMALIAQAASQNENVNKIWGSSDHSIPATNKHEARLLNHSDKMLQPTTPFYDERIKGGKTGFHNQALNTLASYAVNGDVELVAVVMKDNGYDATYQDTKTLIDYGFALYKERKLYGRDMFQRILPVVQHYKDETVDLGTVAVTVSGDITAYTPEFINSDTVGVKYDLPNELEAPIELGQVLGTLTVTYGDTVFGTLDIVPENPVAAIPTSKLDSQRRWRAFKNGLKVIGITLLVVIAVLAAITFGLRAWFISQRKRRGGKKETNSGERAPQPPKKKKKVKIKFK